MIAVSPFNVLGSEALILPAFARLVSQTMTNPLGPPMSLPRFATPKVQPKVEAKSKYPLRYSRSGRRRVLPFPLKLMQILEDDEFSDIISWMPNGKTFIILRPKAFVNKVLPNNFKSVQYTSFTRKLLRWGFSRCEDGTGEFSHPNFQRGRFDLVEKMIPAYMAASTDGVTEEDDDEEETSSAPPIVHTSGPHEENVETSSARNSPTLISLASAAPALTCLGSVPGICSNLSSQHLLAATHRATDLLEVEMESLRLRQRLHLASCSLSANLLPDDRCSILPSPSIDMSGLLTTSPLLEEMRAARVSSAIRLGLLNDASLFGSRERDVPSYPVSLDEILSRAAVVGQHLDPTLIR